MSTDTKNPMNYGYAGDEQITLTAVEFMTLKSAVEHGINATVETYLPEVVRFVNKETSDIVENPSKEDIANGVVVLVTDKDATFNSSNVKVHYNSKLTHDMVRGQQLILEIHERHVESGVAKSSEELQAISDKMKEDMPQETPGVE
jgi:hypothetical protein